AVYLDFPDLPEEARPEPPAFPFIGLVASGGHTAIYRVDGPSHLQITELGATRDDAAGEAYDKVAKLLELGYPGGPIIDRLAREGNAHAVALPQTRITHADRNAPDRPGRLDFSYSGLKTAVLRHVERRRAEHGWPLPQQVVRDLAASFQRVVVESLLDRLFAAARAHGAASAGIAGGVSANSRLREEALRRGEREGLPVFVPSLALSTDNAAMIAAAGLRRLAAGVRAGDD